MSEERSNKHKPLIFEFEGKLPKKKIKNTRMKQVTRALLATCWFLAWLILWPWRWRWHNAPECHLTVDGIHSIISQSYHSYNCENLKPYIVWDCLQLLTTRYNWYGPGTWGHKGANLPIFLIEQGCKTPFVGLSLPIASLMDSGGCEGRRHLG
jgi:hypothetical protein